MLAVGTMVDSLEAMIERIERLEKKVDDLVTSIVRRFDAVDEAFVEQRQYTEFAFSKLEAKIDARFDQVDSRFDRIDSRFDKMDGRFDRLEGKMDDFVSRQSRANDIAERRLSRLERKPSV
jgi:DNA anti-recombination protein RmuC